MARRILERGPRRAVCLCAVPSAHPLASQGEAPGYLALEAAAQTAALLRELADDRAADSAGGSSPPAALRPGYLVGVRQASFGLVLPVESALVASVVLEASMPPLNIYRFGVEWSGHERASGSISIYSD